MFFLLATIVAPNVRELRALVKLVVAVFFFLSRCSCISCKLVNWDHSFIVQRSIDFPGIEQLPVAANSRHSGCHENRRHATEDRSISQLTEQLSLAASRRSTRNGGRMGPITAISYTACFSRHFHRAFPVCTVLFRSFPLADELLNPEIQQA